MKGVRFWGTRGSLPVALTAAGAARASCTSVLRAARGQPLDSDADIERFLGSLPFALAGTYGGHSSCVQIDTGGADYLRLRHGQRRCARSARRRWRSARGKAQTFHIFMSHLHWDHIMGLPFFVPAFIPGNRVVDLRQPPRARSRAAPPAGAAVLPGGLLTIFGADDRVRAPRARRGRTRSPACA